MKIEHIQLNEEEILRDQCDIQNDLYGGKDSEGDRSWDHNDSLVDAKSHLLRWAKQEILKFGAVEDEEDHRESDSNDLNREEYHDTWASQSSHVVQERCLHRHLPNEDTNIDVVAVLSEVGEDEALDDDKVDDRLRNELEHFKTVVLFQ